MKGPKKNDIEKLEKSMIDRIRAFQRSHPANKRCADCTELGPTYICLDYGTFLCQYCCGIHREFGHKIKGISLSQWTVSEVEELERCGNNVANEMWLAKWNSSKDESEPNVEDPGIRRNFLRQKYEDKRWWQADKAKKSEEIKTQVESSTTAAKEDAKQEPVRRAPVEDLLGDFGAEAPQPAAAAVAPASVLELSAPAAVASNSDGWTADFGATPLLASVPTQAHPSGGLFDIDFSGSGAAPGGSQETSLLDVSSASANSNVEASNLQGVSFPSASSTSPDSAAAPAAPAVEDTPGERLRKALLSGSGNELNKLFEQELPQQRYEALQGSLGNLFTRSQPPPPIQSHTFAAQPFANPVAALGPPAQSSGPPPLFNVPALMPPPSASMPSQPADPFAAFGPSSAGSVPPLFSSLALPWHPAPEQHSAPWGQTGQQMSFGGYLPSPAAVPTAYAPSMSAPTSAPFPPLPGPQHAGEQLNFMQSRTANGMQAHTSGLKSAMGAPMGRTPMALNNLNDFGHAVKPSFGLPTSPSQTNQTSPNHESPKETQFGDLLAMFQEKNPINGLGGKQESAMCDLLG